MADSPLRKRQTCAQCSEAETLDKKRFVSSKFHCDTNIDRKRATYSREQGIARDLRPEAAISLLYRLLYRRLS